jgi:hypothetical protein
LRSTGIIRDTDGAFIADQPLDSEWEQLLLGRIQTVLKLHIAG